MLILFLPTGSLYPGEGSPRERILISKIIKVRSYTRNITRIVDRTKVIELTFRSIGKVKL